jgi:spore maturation protein CgeB
VHVGLIGPRGHDLFLDNIGDSLLRMGHQISFLGCARVGLRGSISTSAARVVLNAAPNLEEHIHLRLVRRAVDRGCDAVINIEGGLSPVAVAGLRRQRIKVALWFPDAVSNLGRARMLAAPYNAIFFKDPLLVRRLRDVLGLPVAYLPEACNPRWHRPVGEPGNDGHIVVVGNTYLSRLLLIRRLHEAGIPLAIYGGPPPRWAQKLLPSELFVRPPVFGEVKSRVFRGAAGVLNNLHPAEMHGVNCRLFEATAAGAAVLCESRPALSELFDTDREVMRFVTYSDLLEAIRALLADVRLTRDIGDAATKRAHAEHTYEVRLNTILDTLA